MSNVFILKIDGVIQEFEYTYDQNDRRLDGSSPFTWNNIPSDQFLSIEEAADHIISDFDDSSTQTFKTTKRDDLILFHHGFGTWIRNTYGLWHPKNPNIIPNDPGDGHPDGVSMRIIETIFDKINKTSSALDAYDAAMSII